MSERQKVEDDVPLSCIAANIVFGAKKQQICKFDATFGMIPTVCLCMPAESFNQNLEIGLGAWQRMTSAQLNSHFL